jgi:hypothetical protein
MASVAAVYDRRIFEAIVDFQTRWNESHFGPESAAPEVISGWNLVTPG